MEGSSSKKRRNIDNSTAEQGKFDKILFLNDDSDTSSQKLHESDHYLKVATAPVIEPSTSKPKLTSIAPKSIFSNSPGPYFTYYQNEDIPDNNPAVSINSLSHDPKQTSVSASITPDLNSESVSLTIPEYFSFTEDEFDEIISDEMDSKNAEGSRMTMLLNYMIFKKSLQTDRNNKLTIHLSDILNYFLKNDYGNCLNLDFRFYKVPELEKWNRHRRSLWLYGKPITGKKSFAISLFRNPLVVHDLNDMRKLSKYFYDGIIFCNISFLHISISEQHHLLSVENPGHVYVDDDCIKIPHNTPRVFTSSEKIFDTSDHGNRWRIHFIRINGDLRDMTSKSEYERELDTFIHTDKFHPPIDL
ncbi:hypothetical protein AYI69_g8498 [Smittium culicis]|uniref:Uncharacterized protein n=1 Tax=Smittium culicis TaxID=133412 RepID=A0A1R1XJA6_9FUNG|nr:hypothetical protein AYI69_g8498 [Smittium culicis]